MKNGFHLHCCSECGVDFICPKVTHCNEPLNAPCPDHKAAGATEQYRQQAIEALQCCGKNCEADITAVAAKLRAASMPKKELPTAPKDWEKAIAGLIVYAEEYLQWVRERNLSGAENVAADIKLAKEVLPLLTRS